MSARVRDLDPDDEEAHAPLAEAVGYA